MMNRKYFFAKSIFVLLLFCGVNSFAQEKIKVLFIGNSLTYYNNLPQVVDAMAKSQGDFIDTRHTTIGGSTLENHWKQEKGSQARKMLDNQKWDFVVFNNHSSSAVKNPKKFFEYSKKFADLVREKGAEPIFMMTWAYKSNPLMLSTIKKRHKELSKLTNSDYIPGGTLFAKSIKHRPDLDLFADDRHPSKNGTYLLGLAFYKYFSGKKVTKIPRYVSTTDSNGQKLYLILMNKTDSKYLKQLVTNFSFKTRNK